MKSPADQFQSVGDSQRLQDKASTVDKKELEAFVSLRRKKRWYQKVIIKKEKKKKRNWDFLCTPTRELEKSNEN